MNETRTGMKSIVRTEVLDFEAKGHAKNLVRDSKQRCQEGVEARGQTIDRARSAG